MVLQRERIVRNAERCTLHARGILSVRLSVCLSVRHVPVLCSDQ